MLDASWTMGYNLGMIQHVNAIFEHGVLRPLTPLDLKEQELVVLSVEKAGGNRTDSDDAQPSLFDILDEAGLVGCIKDAPPDLCTNPRYMEGFGESGS
jgi:predicted DNA-binding antitoxin AbrB/MazE fold protein